MNRMSRSDSSMTGGRLGSRGNLIGRRRRKRANLWAATGRFAWWMDTDVQVCGRGSIPRGAQRRERQQQLQQRKRQTLGMDRGILFDLDGTLVDYPAAP